MKQTPIIPVKWIHDQHDTDQDGVPNYRDCDPWNPHEHKKGMSWEDLGYSGYKQKSKKERKRERKKLQQMEKYRELYPDFTFGEKRKHLSEHEIRKRKLKAYEIPGVDEVEFY